MRGAWAPRSGITLLSSRPSEARAGTHLSRYSCGAMGPGSRASRSAGMTMRIVQRSSPEAIADNFSGSASIRIITRQQRAAAVVDSMPLPTRSLTQVVLALRGCLEVLVEPVQRALPGEFGRGFVVTRRRVVVEAVLRGFVHMAFVRHLGRGQRLLVGRPA